MMTKEKSPEAPTEIVAGDGCKYREISAILRQEIACGKYAGADRFPSEEMLIRRFRHARGTIRMALAELERAGLVCRRRGSGTTVTMRTNPATGRLGLLVPDMGQWTFFRLLSSEFVRLANAGHYVLIVGECPAAGRSLRVKNIRRFVREFIAQRVEGVIFRPFLDEALAEENHRIVEAFSRQRIPVVLIDSDIVQSPERSAYDLVGINNVDAGRLAAQHLISRGRKRVFYQMHEISTVTRNRFFGVMGAVLAAGGKWSDERIIRIMPDDRQAYRTLFVRKDRAPDAIVCEDDEVAVQVLKTLTGLGIRVPEDVAVVGCDDIPLARAQTPELTTIHQPVELIAEAAYRMLVTRIRQTDLAPRETLFAAPLTVRGSS